MYNCGRKITRRVGGADDGCRSKCGSSNECRRALEVSRSPALGELEADPIWSLSRGHSGTCSRASNTGTL